MPSTPWAEHLRDGGTTTWTTWSDQAGGRDEPDTTDRARPTDGCRFEAFEPDATHLELLRRLNLTAAPSGWVGWPTSS